LLPHCGGCRVARLLRRLTVAIAVAAFLPLGGAAQTAASPTKPPVPATPSFAADYGKLPLSFEANKGQSDPRVKFLSRGSGYSLFLTDRAAVLSLTKGNAATQGKPTPGMRGSPAKPPKTDLVRMELVGASHLASVKGVDPLPGRANYFIGNDPAKWHANVPTYAKVKYQGVYPGIDLVYYGNQRQLEYDFIVAPGADPKSIRLQFSDATRLKLTKDGDLQIAANDGEIAFHNPVVYQIKDGQKEPLQANFQLLARNEVTFKVGNYDKMRELIIDPILAYSTYLGGTGNDAATAIAVDTTGSAYVTGYTLSPNFPTSASAYQTTNNNTTYGVAFVTKLNPSGSDIVYSTYLGGNQGDCRSIDPNLYYIGDRGVAIAVDESGEAYVSGTACSTNFPTTAGAFQTTNKGASNHVPNVFVTKLNANGAGLSYSTYFGGSGSSLSGDFAGGIAVDSSGNTYIAGQTYSHDFPVTAGALQQTNYTYQAAFVAKLNAAGSASSYATYLGGTSGNGTAANSIAADTEGNVYVTGATFSTSFPTTPGAFQTTAPMTNNSGNAFVAKLDPSGAALVYSTYLGGAGNGVSFGCGDYGNRIAVDNANDAYVAGQTCSANFPTTPGAFQKTHSNVNQWTGFVTKFNPTASAPIYSTYLGGTNGDGINDLALSPGGEAFVTGYTYSSDFPTTSGAFQTNNNGTINRASNAFMTEMNTTGSAPLYSTYLGGSGNSSGNGDVARGIALDSHGDPFLAGGSYSTNFPTTTDSFQPKTNATAGNSNAFIASFAFAAATTTALVTNGTPAAAGTQVTFTATVTPTSGSDTPSGTVDFSIDGGNSVPETLNSEGQAVYSTLSLAPGVHKIVASYLGDATLLASTSSTLQQTIYGAASSLTAVSGSGQSSTYGTAFKAPLVVVVKDAAGDVVPGVTVTFTGAGLAFSPASAVTGSNGEVSVTATPVAVGSLTASATASGIAKPVTFSLTATKAVLRVTATNISVTYNSAISALTYTVTGFVNGDTSKVVTGTPGETTTATKGSAPGTYPITLTMGTLAATNYSFTLVNGTVTITPLGTAATPGVTQLVTIAEATSGATVYYTTNGTTPTTSSTKYTGPITLTSGATLKFIAVAPGYTNSPVRTVTDTVQ
jgi:hypothetical protein